jgi:hypothetical protein
MAAIAFDPLGYTRELEASGVPRNQAEVHAKAMTATFLHNFDSLVTRDYLDTRFTEFEARIMSVMDRRFAGVDSHFVKLETSLEQRFVAIESNIDRRFSEANANIDKRFAESDAKFDKRFAESDARIDKGFAESDAKFDKDFAESDARINQLFAELRLELHREIASIRGELADLKSKFNVQAWMLALLIAGVFVPMLQRVFV